MDTFSIILSISIGLAAIVSPIVVALINNHYANKLRLAELKHDEEIKRIEVKQQISERQQSLEFNTKKEAFSELIDCAGKYYSETDNNNLLANLYSSAYKAASICSFDYSRNKIDNFISEATQKFCSDGEENKPYLFCEKLSLLSEVIKKELFYSDCTNNTEE